VLPRVVVVNGGSSAGKTTLVRRLQERLAEPWLAVSVDGFVDALPPALRDSPAGFGVAAGGAVEVGAEFRRLEAAWMAGVAATARAGAPVLVDDVFLAGAGSQARWRAALAGLPAAYVGVRCDPAVAARREAARPDRPAGMAAAQARSVHAGVAYDVEVDTTATPAATCADEVAARLRGWTPPGPPRPSGPAG
jgi:chloramphenicol 3-O phosphotransferase